MLTASAATTRAAPASTTRSRGVPGLPSTGAETSSSLWCIQTATTPAPTARTAQNNAIHGSEAVGQGLGRVRPVQAYSATSSLAGTATPPRGATVDVGQPPG